MKKEIEERPLWRKFLHMPIAFGRELTWVGLTKKILELKNILTRTLSVF